MVVGYLCKGHISVSFTNFNDNTIKNAFHQSSFPLTYILKTGKHGQLFQFTCPVNTFDFICQGHMTSVVTW